MVSQMPLCSIQSYIGVVIFKSYNTSTITMIGANKHHCLFIDESGAPALSHFDRNYTLCGIIVRPYQTESIKVYADRIKFKYWNDTNVVFHSEEIGKKKNDFAILQNPNIEKAFIKDLLDFLDNTDFRCIVISVDKTKAVANGWNSKQIQDVAMDKMIEFFISFLATKSFRGKIVMESSGGKDVSFYKRYSAYLSKGYAPLGLTHVDVKQLLTSISFVSKNNHDAETQLADLFAYPATRQFLHNESVKPLIVGSYEHSICEIMKKKIITIGNQSAFVRLPE